MIYISEKVICIRGMLSCISWNVICIFWNLTKGILFPRISWKKGSSNVGEICFSNWGCRLLASPYLESLLLKFRSTACNCVYSHEEQFNWKFYLIHLTWLLFFLIVLCTVLFQGCVYQAGVVATMTEHGDASVNSAPSYLQVRLLVIITEPLVITMHNSVSKVYNIRELWHYSTASLLKASRNVVTHQWITKLKYISGHKKRSLILFLLL